MRNIIFVALFVACLLAMCGAAPAPDAISDPAPLLFVMAGQSNANRIAPWIDDAAALYGLGPVMVINCSDIAGGASIWDWQWDGFLYRRCISLIIQSGLTPAAIFFHQGERDSQSSIHESGTQWRTYFSAMVAQFRAQTGQPDLIVEAAKISPDLDPVMFPQLALVRSKQNTLYGTPLPNVRLIFADEVPLGDDGIHYNDPEAFWMARKFILIYTQMIAAYRVTPEQ